MARRAMGEDGLQLSMRRGWSAGAARPSTDTWPPRRSRPDTVRESGFRKLALWDRLVGGAEALARCSNGPSRSTNGLGTAVSVMTETPWGQSPRQAWRSALP